jgi:hypothetical protein
MCFFDDPFAHNFDLTEVVSCVLGLVPNSFRPLTTMHPQSTTPLHVPVLYEAPSSEPLLEEDEKEQHQPVPKLDDTMFRKFKASSLVLGLMVGFFIQFSTLGANFLMITLWGEDVMTKSKHDIVVFSLVWSFFTSAMAIVILGFLRNIITTVTTQDVDELVLHMECRFVVGALIGVCFAWTATDMVLGMRAQIVYSLVTLTVALAWCRVMMWCFTTTTTTEEEESKTDKKQIPDVLHIV